MENFKKLMNDIILAVQDNSMWIIEFSWNICDDAMFRFKYSYAVI